MVSVSRHISDGERELRQDPSPKRAGHYVSPVTVQGIVEAACTIQNSHVVKDKLPISAEVATEVGDNQVRNMGTIGGWSRMPMPPATTPTIALILDAEIVTNQRKIAAKDFFKDLFTTPLAADEIVTEVGFPVAAGPHKCIKSRRRLFDWAIVGAAAQKLNGRRRIGLMNVGPTPVRAKGVEQALQKSAPAGGCGSARVGWPEPVWRPPRELRVPKHLARVLTKRAIEQVASLRVYR
jgi:carbon-monoxide dehydrogenase medium subunit